MTTTKQVSTLAAPVELGFNRMLAVRLARLAHRGDPNWPGLLRALVPCALTASLPIHIELVARLFAPTYALHTLEAVSWVAILSALSMFGLLCAWWVWTHLAETAPHLDTMIREPGLRSALANVLIRSMSIRRQLAVTVIGAAGCCLLLRLIQPYIVANLEMGPVSYLAIFWATLIGGNCAYWMAFFVFFASRILRSGELNLVWHSPASTPAIARMSTGYAFTTMVTLIALLALEVLSIRASTYGTSAVLDSVIRAIPPIAAVCALATGIIPHMLLFVAVRNSRRAALLALLPLTGAEPPTTAQEVKSIQENIALYRLVETSPGLPFSTAAIIQYGAAIFGSIVAFFLST
ncbi:hypothetical protein ACIBQ2_13215 [Micromonospora sediminimaris]|uniref:hypothetical protein n=1 Tax=Micromonospora sediminimaris TaxID=547162 RepID=UPI0037B9562D